MMVLVDLTFRLFCSAGEYCASLTPGVEETFNGKEEFAFRPSRQRLKVVSLKRESKVKVSRDQTTHLIGRVRSLPSLDSIPPNQGK